MIPKNEPKIPGIGNGNSREIIPKRTAYLASTYHVWWPLDGQLALLGAHFERLNERNYKLLNFIVFGEQYFSKYLRIWHLLRMSVICLIVIGL